jgi:hypothetical protein
MATGLTYWLKTKAQLTARFIMTRPLARIRKGKLKRDEISIRDERKQGANRATYISTV